MVPTPEHIPVLLSEAIEALAIKPEGIYVDGTLGLGGHARAIASQLTTGHLYAFDLDPDNLAQARQNLAPWSDKITFIEDNFVHFPEHLSSRQINGFLLDLGVSSTQLDRLERGFSFRSGSPLDMRFSPHQKESAYDLINFASAEELARLFRTYGEERNAWIIARRIVEQRATSPLTEAETLVAIAAKVNRSKDKHPATRIFQALRIAVNHELEVLEQVLPPAIQLLAPGGRGVVIAYHSLEDRIVKNIFRDEATSCLCDKALPICVCHHQPTIKLITKKPLTPTPTELAHNPRSRSAKMRIIEKL